MAGINDGMVVTPDNLAVMSGYPAIPLIADLRTFHQRGPGSYYIRYVAWWLQRYSIQRHDERRGD
jgi:hypothetical protein